MGPTICKHRTTEHIKIKQPWEGLTVAIYSQLDVTPLTEPAEWSLGRDMIDPWKIIVSLRNNKKGVDCWNMSLGRLVQFLNRNQDDALPFLTFNPGARLVTVEDGALPETEARLFDFSFNFGLGEGMNVYDGDYTLTVEMKDAMPNGTRLNSYLSITPVMSDEAMINELVIDDVSLDKDHLDIALGNGIACVTISEDIDITDVAPITPKYNTLVAKVSRVNYTSVEQQCSFNNHDLQAHTRSFLEVRTNPLFIAPSLTIHDREINTNMNVHVEMSIPSTSVYIIHAKLINNPNQEVSESVAQSKYNRKQDAIESASY